MPQPPRRYPFVVPPIKPSPEKLDPWPDSPVTLTFRNEIARRESGPDGYRAFTPKGGGIGALGRYQLRKGALIDAGFMEEGGRWTGEQGVWSAEDFLANPTAQEIAFARYMQKNQDYLTILPRGYRDIGQKIFSGPTTFAITENGLAAAAHREGAGAVQSYLQYLADRGWVSDFSGLSDKERQIFENVERRLREFADIPYRHPLPIPPRKPALRVGSPAGHTEPEP